MPSRVIRPLIEQKVLASIDNRARVLETSEDFLKRELQKVAFRRQECAVAGVVGDTPAEAVHRVVTENRVEVGNRTRQAVWDVDTRVADFDVLAAIRDACREIIFDPLVAKLRAAAAALLVPVAILASEVRAAEAQGVR